VGPCDNESMRADDLHTLPPDLPVPVDDGGARHLPGAALPDVLLPSTGRQPVRLASLPGRSVVFAYPRTGHPDRPLGKPGEWDAIPGARGCTTEVCGIRDEIAGFAEHGAAVFGLSTQSPADQREAAARLRLPYPLLSDQALTFSSALGMPTLEFEGLTLLKRITLFVRDGRIEDVIYPVFPPDAAAREALAWVAEQR